MANLRNKNTFLFLEVPYVFASLILVAGLLYYRMTSLLDLNSRGVLALIVPTTLFVLSGLIAGYRLKYRLFFPSASGDFRDITGDKRQALKALRKTVPCIILSASAQIYAVGLLMGNRDFALGIGLAIIGLTATALMIPLWKYTLILMPPFKKWAAQASSVPQTGKND